MTSGSGPSVGTGYRVEWRAPRTIVPTDVQVTMPDWTPGRYATPDGWLDVAPGNDRSGGVR